MLIEAVGAIFTFGWTMLTSVKFPGSEMPIAVIIIGAFVIGFAIRIFAFVMRMTVNVDDSVGTRAEKSIALRKEIKRRK
jgi:multisubunit Na+/H+ antiporter MnhC subunit